MLFGVAESIDDGERKKAALCRFVDGLFPGRWCDLRPVNAQELKATVVLRFPREEASAKIREGGVVEDEADADLPIWAGVIPLSLVAGAPVADSHNKPMLETPCYLRHWRLDRRRPPEETEKDVHHKAGGLSGE